MNVFNETYQTKYTGILQHKHHTNPFMIHILLAKIIIFHYPSYIWTKMTYANDLWDSAATASCFILTAKPFKNHDVTSFLTHHLPNNETCLCVLQMPVQPQQKYYCFKEQSDEQ